MSFKNTGLITVKLYLMELIFEHRNA